MVPSDKTEEVSRILDQTWAAYTQNRLELNKQLLTGEGGFSYNDVAVVSERYWDAVIQTRMSLTELQTTLVEAGEETSPLNEKISMKLQEVNINFYEYYGQMPFYSAEEEFIEQLQLFADSFTQDNARQIRRWLAEIPVLPGKYRSPPLAVLEYFRGRTGVLPCQDWLNERSSKWKAYTILKNFCLINKKW